MPRCVARNSTIIVSKILLFKRRLIKTMTQTSLKSKAPKNKWDNPMHSRHPPKNSCWILGMKSWCRGDLMRMTITFHWSRISIRTQAHGLHISNHLWFSALETILGAKNQIIRMIRPSSTRKMIMVNINTPTTL